MEGISHGCETNESKRTPEESCVDEGRPSQPQGAFKEQNSGFQNLQAHETK
jgi:hypothetical protein